MNPQRTGLAYPCVPSPKAKWKLTHRSSWSLLVSNATQPRFLHASNIGRAVFVPRTFREYEEAGVGRGAREPPASTQRRREHRRRTPHGEYDTSTTHDPSLHDSSRSTQTEVSPITHSSKSSIAKNAVSARIPPGGRRRHLGAHRREGEPADVARPYFDLRARLSSQDAQDNMNAVRAWTLPPDTCGPTPSRRCRLSRLGAPFSFRLRIAPPPALLPGALGKRDAVLRRASKIAVSTQHVSSSIASIMPRRLARHFDSPASFEARPPSTLACDSQDARHKTKPAHKTAPGRDMRIAAAFSTPAQRLWHLRDPPAPTVPVNPGALPIRQYSHRLRGLRAWMQSPHRAPRSPASATSSNATRVRCPYLKVAASELGGDFGGGTAGVRVPRCGSSASALAQGHKRAADSMCTGGWQGRDYDVNLGLGLVHKTHPPTQARLDQLGIAYGCGSDSSAKHTRIGLRNARRERNDLSKYIDFQSLVGAMPRGAEQGLRF
ncbi:hypothetical protein MSAN_00223400 [Mycena sanguinolenta]|uniref:Uncharacterized protein n=1 Tax=Mycena sanguinolenta TaxID=230812 RepID=A0A8H7DKZ1_9AGAR|nr:hypothetical protein MSAN_00223400 [Mycena sanguinolenta]